MIKCPQCGKDYPDDYVHCPMDGSQLAEQNQKNPDTLQKSVVERPFAFIRIRTLMFGFLILLSVFILSFASVFLYQYWKPKFGNLSIKSTPPGINIFVDGNPRGTTPLTLSNMRSGKYVLKGTGEGYKEHTQNVFIIPYTTQTLHWNLDPIVSQLTNKQLAQIEAWRKKLETAQSETILLPPPEDYNVLYFADRILDVDPTNEFALNVKNELVENIRTRAELAYAQEEWLEAEKLYKNLTLLLQYDLATENRLADIAIQIGESIQDRNKEVVRLKTLAETAIKDGRLLPPDRDNALDAVREIQRLDTSSIYVQEITERLKKNLQNRGDSKTFAGDWTGARDDFKIILQYFPEDIYSRTRLSSIEDKVVEMEQSNQQLNQNEYQKEQLQKRLSTLRRSALNLFHKGSYQESIAEWAEILRLKSDSDEAYFYLGASYQGEKQMDTAIFNYEKCLSINPDHAPSHLNLGMLYDYHRNNFQVAGEHFKKAMELGGTSGYGPDRIQAMIQSLEDRAQTETVLKALFPAEHLHMFTSCRGNLRFTEEGVEYVTTETDHSFYEKFQELSLLSLKDNELTIKTRNKTYNLRFLNKKDAVRLKAWGVSSGKIQSAVRSP